MLSLNEKLSEVQLLRLRATFHALPLFYLQTYILGTYARKNNATLWKSTLTLAFITSALSFQPPPAFQNEWPLSLIRCSCHFEIEWLE